MKKKPEEHVNLERWMVSYADFMTLLFALFVVLYSFAMAKQSEAQAMAESVAESFNQDGVISSSGGVLLVPGAISQQLTQQATSSNEQSDSKNAAQNSGVVMTFVTSSTTSQSQNQDEETDTSGSGIDEDAMSSSDSSTSSGDLIMSENQISNNDVPSSENPTGGSDSGHGGMTPGGSADEIADGGRTSVDSKSKGEGRNGAPFDALRKSISSTLADMGMEKQVDIEEDEHWLTVNISSGMLFAEGSASILNASKPLISKIAIVLSSINNYIRIRGYTDNSFIPNGIFRNSWDLSAMRAVNVLTEFETDGIDPRRMAIEAYGEYSPFYSNSTAAGRAQNRRVVIAISRFAMVQEEPQVVGDGDFVYDSNEGSDGNGNRAGGGVDVVREEDNTIRLDFSK